MKSPTGKAPSDALSEGKRLEDNGDLGGAAQALARLSEDYPGDLAVRFYYGEVLFRQSTLPRLCLSSSGCFKANPWMNGLHSACSIPYGRAGVKKRPSKKSAVFSTKVESLWNIGGCSRI